MGTKASFAAFLRDDVNSCFKAILSFWGNFPTTHPSVQTVTTAEGGWLSPTAQADPSTPGLKAFLKTYRVPDPGDDTCYGFTSWDQFFARRFLPGVREVDSPADPRVVVSAAESIPFYIQENVQLEDSFWAKDQHYSLSHLLGNSEMAAHFVGGTVYQALLSADCYHKLARPSIRPLPLAAGYRSRSILFRAAPRGSSSASNSCQSEPIPSPDAAAVKSQGYMSCIAKRGVAYIQPDDRTLGLIALVMIGMAEVSSVEFDSLESFGEGPGARSLPF